MKLVIAILSPFAVMLSKDTTKKEMNFFIAGYFPYKSIQSLVRLECLLVVNYDAAKLFL
jgi:hypothetical protein